MKKIRIPLTVMALALAIGGTFASKYQPVPTTTGYEYIAGVPDLCIEITPICNPTGPNLCTFNGHKIGDSSSISSQCGTQLKRE